MGHPEVSHELSGLTTSCSVAKKAHFGTLSPTEINQPLAPLLLREAALRRGPAPSPPQVTLPHSGFKPDLPRSSPRGPKGQLQSSNPCHRSLPLQDHWARARHLGHYWTILRTEPPIMGGTKGGPRIYCFFATLHRKRV